MKMRLGVGRLLLVTLIFWAMPLLAQGTPPIPATVTENVPEGNYVALIVIYLVAILSVPLSLLLSDLFKAYGFAKMTRASLIDKAAANDLSLDELNAMLSELQKAPPGIPGLTRGSLALTVLVILAVAIIHILVVRRGVVGTEINQVLTLLGGVLATIVGFYFGGRTAETGAQAMALASRAQTSTATASGALAITDVQPRKAAPGSMLSIRGSGFGATQGTVTFNGTNAASIGRWSDSEIQAAVPREILGFVEVTVTRAGGTAVTAGPETSPTVAVEP